MHCLSGGVTAPFRLRTIAFPRFVSWPSKSLHPLECPPPAMTEGYTWKDTKADTDIDLEETGER